MIYRSISVGRIKTFMHASESKQHLIPRGLLGLGLHSGVGLAPNSSQLLKDVQNLVMVADGEGQGMSLASTMHGDKRKRLLTCNCVKGGLEGALRDVLLVFSFEVEFESLAVPLHLQCHPIKFSQIQIQRLFAQ